MAPKALGQELEQGGFWPQKVLVPYIVTFLIVGMKNLVQCAPSNI